VNPALAAGAVVLGAFLSGSVPYGLLWARARGIDVRRVGSGNIGATNVGRALGRRAGAAVLLLDAAKGALPVGAAIALARAGLCPGWTASAAAVAAVVGHCFPPWLRFRGGKGVATALGVFVAVDPRTTAVSVAVFAVMYAAWRKVSLGSLAAAAAFPLAAWLLGRPAHEIGAAVLVAAVIVLRHRDNLARLRRGSEPGAGPPAA
jgi:acyl phosphate:glycerol-3-phosphate acyltransferase